jgi:16S rRNA (guanine966-N2)-methyltransferase
MGKKYIRIVGGQYRRTPIEVIDAPGLRPTPDRVRETLFNWLSHLWGANFDDKRILDLFAGSGALGFEAASRGCGHVAMVERHAPAVANLRALREKLDAAAVHIHAGDALILLRRLASPPFDLILLDPPFGQDFLARLWPLLPAALAPYALVYVESEKPLAAPQGFEIIRQDKAGVVYYGLLRFAALQKTMNNPASEEGDTVNGMEHS